MISSFYVALVFWGALQNNTNRDFSARLIDRSEYTEQAMLHLFDRANFAGRNLQMIQKESDSFQKQAEIKKRMFELNNDLIDATNQMSILSQKQCSISRSKVASGQTAKRFLMSPHGKGSDKKKARRLKTHLKDRSINIIT